MANYNTQTNNQDTGLVCGNQVQIDRSGGQGHCWRNVSTDEIPADIREEIEGEMIDGGVESCEGFRAGDGEVYRW